MEKLLQWCIDFVIKFWIIRFFFGGNPEMSKLESQGKSTPRITIIVPVFNAHIYIEKCIASITAQARWLHELIVVDGGSSDGTIEEVIRLASFNSVIKFYSEPDRGQSDAMNKGLSLATGSVIGFVNADDWLWEGALEQVYMAFRDDALDMFLGAITIYSDGFHRCHMPSASMFDLLEIKSFRWPLNPVGYFCSRRLHCRVGSYPMDNHTCMDYWFLLRSFSVAQVIQCTSIVLGSYYIHGGNKSQIAPDIMSDLRRVRSDFISEKGGLKVMLILGLIGTREAGVRLMVKARSKAYRLISILRRLL